LKLAYINDELKIFSGEDPGLSSFKGGSEWKGGGS